MESVPAEEAEEGDAMAEQAVESVPAETTGEVEMRQDDELFVFQDPSVDEESAGEIMLPAKKDSVDEESADTMQHGSTVDEQSAGEIKANSVSGDEKSPDTESEAKESPVKMTRRGCAIKPPSHLQDYSCK